MLTHMLDLNSNFFHLIGQFLVPNPSSHLHSALKPATRELLPEWKCGTLSGKKNGTHMLNLNSHFFQLIGRFLVPNPSRHLHPAFTLATRELLPPRKELEQKRRPAGCLISSWKPAKRHCNPDVRSHQCPAAGTILVEKLRQARVD